MAEELNSELVYALPTMPKGRILLVNVGDDNRPATEDDIRDVIKCIGDARDRMDKDGTAIFVTHHLVKMKVVRV